MSDATGLPPAGAPESAPTESAPAPADPPVRKPASLVTTRTGIFNSQVTGGPDGCYALGQNAEGAYNLFYIDRASHAMVYLSSDPQSQHRDETDSSYLGDCPGGAALFRVGGHVYVVTLGTLPFGDMPAQPACIRRMELNGAGQTVLCTLSEHLLQNTPFAFDGDSLFFLADRTLTGTTELLCLSVEDGTLRPLLSLAQDGCFYRLAGTVPEGFVLQKTAFTEEGGQGALLVFCPDTEQLRTVFEYDPAVRSFLVGENGSAYSYSPADGAVRVLSLADGSERVLNAQTVPEGEAGHFTPVGDFYDGRFFLLDQNTNDLYAVSCSDGLAVKIGLQRKGFNPSVQCETGSQFLVMTGFSEKTSSEAILRGMWQIRR